ncbi:MAG: polyphosphate kinase 2 family protein [Burkholderiales bacterium]
MAKSEYKKIRKLINPYRVTNGRKFRLKDVDPGDTGGLKSEVKGKAKEYLARGVELLADEQARLYAQDRWSVLLIFQAMDAAGKDGVIKHVTSGIDPQGMQVYSFKAPSSEELDHDFMWRCMKALPERGRIGVFNRSYYEEVLAVRVHEAYLLKQKLPRRLVTKRVWEERYQDIRSIERYLSRNGTLILKFFLHVSKKEQKKRFMERLDRPEKNWKFSATDAGQREYWRAYMDSFEQMIRNTATDCAPWYVIPADNKWFTRLAVSDAIIDALDKLDLEFPKIDDAKKKELAAARKLLMNE